MTRLLQGYIDNEVNLNPINDCKKTCSDHKLTSNEICYNGTYCAQEPKEVQDARKCKGVVVDCDFVGSDLTICPSVILYLKKKYIPEY